MGVLASATFALAVTGCVPHLPNVVRKSTSEEGLHSVQTYKHIGFVYSTSISFLPGTEGEGEGKKGFPHSEKCRQFQVTVKVFYSRFYEKPLAKSACDLITRTIKYMERYGSTSSIIEYQAILVDNYSSFETTNWSLYPFSKIKPRFAFRTANSNHLESALADTFAHEFVHMFVDLKRGNSRTDEEEAEAREERAAYFAGICAQLHTIGIVRAESLPGAPISGASIPLAVSRSSKQGYAVRREVYGYLKNGRIVAETPNGKALKRKCDHELGAFFGAD